MAEQEREKNKEAEKRLKAALTAKREPSATASRVASPAIGNPATPESVDPKPTSTSEPEAPMDVDVTTPSQKEVVSSSYFSSCSVRADFVFNRALGFRNCKLCSTMLRPLHLEMHMILLGE